MWRRGDHEAAACAEDVDLLGHVGFDLLRAAVGQQLLWSMAPQKEIRSPNLSFNSCGSWPGTLGCTGLKTSSPDLDQVFEDRRDCAIAVIHDQQVRVGGAEFLKQFR